MASPTSKKIKEHLSKMSLADLKLVGRDINANLDDEDPVRISLPKAKLIKEILLFNAKDVWNSVQVVESKEPAEDDFRKNLKKAFFAVPKTKQEERPYQKDLTHKVFEAIEAKRNSTVAVATGG